MSLLDWQPSDRRPSRPKREKKRPRSRTDERIRALDVRGSMVAWLLTIPIGAGFAGFLAAMLHFDPPRQAWWIFAGASLGFIVPAGRAAWITFRLVRSGRPDLRLSECPVRPGDEMKGLLRFRRGFGPHDELRIRLLCSRERARTERDKRGKSWHAYSRQDGLVIEETAHADREVPVRIAIHEGAPVTGDKGVYWELVVTGAGVNVAFPIPVY